MEDINLHFTGDMHAITSANNLLASIIDNSIYQKMRILKEQSTLIEILNLEDIKLLCSTTSIKFYTHSFSYVIRIYKTNVPFY